MYPEQLVEEIRRRWDSVRGIPELSVLWVTLSTDRGEFADALRRTRGEWPLVPVILRMPGLFRDTNAVMNDVTRILHDIRHEIMDRADCIRRFNGVGLVVLSRSELRLAATSSPLRLPEWFPVMAGAEVAARIDDLTWSVHVRLSDEATAVNDLQRILHELDKVVVVRLQEGLKSDHRHKLSGTVSAVRTRAISAMFSRESTRRSTASRIRPTSGRVHREARRWSGDCGSRRTGNLPTSCGGWRRRWPAPCVPTRLSSETT